MYVPPRAFRLCRGNLVRPGARTVIIVMSAFSGPFLGTSLRKPLRIKHAKPLTAGPDYIRFLVERLLYFFDDVGSEWFFV